MKLTDLRFAEICSPWFNCQIRNKNISIRIRRSFILWISFLVHVGVITNVAVAIICGVRFVIFLSVVADEWLVLLRFCALLQIPRHGNLSYRSVHHHFLRDYCHCRCYLHCRQLHLSMEFDVPIALCMSLAHLSGTCIDGLQPSVPIVGGCLTGTSFTPTLLETLCKRRFLLFRNASNVFLFCLYRIISVYLSQRTSHHFLLRSLYRQYIGRKRDPHLYQVSENSIFGRRKDRVI